MNQDSETKPSKATIKSRIHLAIQSLQNRIYNRHHVHKPTSRSEPDSLSESVYVSPQLQPRPSNNAQEVMVGANARNQALDAGVGAIDERMVYKTRGKKGRAAITADTYRRDAGVGAGAGVVAGAGVGAVADNIPEIAHKPVATVTPQRVVKPSSPDVKLSDMDGVTFFLTPTYHQDLLPQIVMDDFLIHSVSTDEALKKKTAIFLENDNEGVSKNPNAAMFSSQSIRDWKSKGGRPSTPRASFFDGAKRMGEVERNIMKLTGVEKNESGRYGPVGRNAHPDINLFGVDNEAKCDEYRDIEADFFARGMGSSPEWVMKRTELIYERNESMAKNIAQHIKRGDIKLAAGAFGALHETEPYCKPLSKHIKEQCEKLNIKCNVVVVPVSRDKLPIVDQDSEFYDRMHNESVSPDGLSRASFGPTNFKTANQIFIPDSNPNVNHGSRIFKHVMDTISRQEALKKPEDRRVKQGAVAVAVADSAKRADLIGGAWSQNFERRRVPVNRELGNGGWAM